MGKKGSHIFLPQNLFLRLSLHFFLSTQKREILILASLKKSCTNKKQDLNVHSNYLFFIIDSTNNILSESVYSNTLTGQTESKLSIRLYSYFTEFNQV
jgi:hypothetical protein